MEDEYVMVNGRKLFPVRCIKAIRSIMEQLLICIIRLEDSLMYLNGNHNTKKQQFILRPIDEEDVYQKLWKCQSLQTNQKKSFTLLHQHLPFGIQVKDVAFLHNAKYTITLCYNTSSHDTSYISVFKTNTEQLITLITYSDVDENYVGLFRTYKDFEQFGTFGPNVLKIWKFNPIEKQLDDVFLDYEGVITHVKNIPYEQKRNLVLLSQKKIINSANISNDMNKIPTVQLLTQKELLEDSKINQLLLCMKDIKELQNIQSNILQILKMILIFQLLLNIKQDKQKMKKQIVKYIFLILDLQIIQILLFEILLSNFFHKVFIKVKFQMQNHLIKTNNFTIMYGFTSYAILMCKRLQRRTEIFVVLHDELKQVYYESLKQCSVVKYIPGGNELAFGSQNQILIYDPQKYRLIQTISGHMGTIASLEWCDNTLISTQGLVMVFNQSRLVDHSFKLHKGFCQTYDPEYDFLIESYSDSKVKIFNEKGQKFIF
ncbi:unnamed protein product [Paramecium sonneborni]|uniref:Uncharacterized protein n=1 Tax=Paramecium sonneborni TaxID=65129 RepID=A0A8S1RUV1_9CILI|nr:unnamed protein product [Paramecium sonneborni]